MEAMTNLYKILGGESEKKPPARPRRKFEDSTKIGLKENGCDDVE
jgi:hypothetical protein